MKVEKILYYLQKETNWKIAKIQLTGFRNILLLSIGLSVVFLLFFCKLKNDILIKWFSASFFQILFVLPFYIVSKVKERKAYKVLNEIN